MLHTIFKKVTQYSKFCSTNNDLVNPIFNQLWKNVLNLVKKCLKKKILHNIAGIVQPISKVVPKLFLLWNLKGDILKKVF